MNNHLTEEDYMDKGGLQCPKCQETGGVIADGILDVYDGGANQDVHCTLCNAAWSDLYKLVGYEGLIE